jgi:hypothetical protein
MPKNLIEEINKRIGNEYPKFKRGMNELIESEYVDLKHQIRTELKSHPRLKGKKLVDYLSFAFNLSPPEETNLYNSSKDGGGSSLASVAKISIPGTSILAKSELFGPLGDIFQILTIMYVAMLYYGFGVDLGAAAAVYSGSTIWKGTDKFVLKKYFYK